MVRIGVWPTTELSIQRYLASEDPVVALHDVRPKYNVVHVRRTMAVRAYAALSP